MSGKHHVSVRKRIARKRVNRTHEREKPEPDSRPLQTVGDAAGLFLTDIGDTRPWILFAAVLQLCGAALFCGLFVWQIMRFARLGGSGEGLLISPRMIMDGIFTAGCGLSSGLLACLGWRSIEWRRAATRLARRRDDTSLDQLITSLGGIWRLTGATWLIVSATVALACWMLAPAR